MFTGLVTDVGTVRSVEDRNGLRRFEVESAYPLDEIEMGASIMHSGVCLTVVDMGQGERGAWFATEAVPETLSKTILGDWHVGSRVNLEQSLKLGDQLGGHFVFGHVDGVGQVGLGIFDGQVVDVPSLSAPGFIKADADKGYFPDISSCSSIVIEANTSDPYDGYR